MILSKPMPCPNTKDVRGDTHPPGCTYCQNGYIYYGNQTFKGNIFGNSNTRQFQSQGAIDYDSAQVEIPATDSRGAPLSPSFFDKIILDCEPVRFYQRIEHSQTGVDKLHFPAVKVEKVLGADFKEYYPVKDFVINPVGRIEWIGSRPKYDAALDSGEIYSITYLIKPSYVVINIPSQVAMAQTVVDGETILQRLPSMVQVRREFVPHDLNGQRLAPAQPRDGNL